VDYSGRTIIAKPFQAALGAGDKPMWEMMLPYFTKLEEKEPLKQFHEWFPNGIEEVPESEFQAHYNAIASAIITDADHGHAMIEQFRSDLCKKEITHGKHFNLQELVAAYQAYVHHFDALGTWDNRDLFWPKVIGYVQRQMTAYDAQVHCSGVQSVLENNDAFSRSLAFYKGGTFFPLSVDAGLGFDFGCMPAEERCFGDLPGGGAAGVAAVRRLRAGLKNYVEQKQNHLSDLESHLRQERIISACPNWCRVIS
jgi:hypothetical protein